MHRAWHGALVPSCRDTKCTAQQKMNGLEMKINAVDKDGQGAHMGRRVLQRELPSPMEVLDAALF